MATRQLEAEFDGLKDELDKLRKQVSSFGEAASEGIQRGSRRARAAAGQALDTASEGLSDAAGEVERRGRQSLDAVEHQIEDRPLISVLVAFGLGVLVGKLLDR
jgi:ElaB/YqjD/DUF883 family membrane-anchored ribosome-binding protein